MDSAYETQDEESTQVRRHTETDALMPDHIDTSKPLGRMTTSDANDDFASNTVGGNSITHQHRTKLMLFLNSIKNLSNMSGTFDRPACPFTVESLARMNSNYTEQYT